MAQLYSNNARSTLVAAITATATSLEVVGTDAAKFPAPTSGDFFDMTLHDATSLEIVRITARTGGVMTISARALEGTTAAAFAVGTVAGIRLTAAATAGAVNHAALATGAHAASAISNAPAGNIAATTVQAALNELDAEKLSNVAGAVLTANLADLGVTTAKLADLGVTTAKLADLGVTTAKIADLGVTTAKIAADAVTYAKIQNVTVTDRLLGRVTAGAGDVEEIICTPFARTLLDDADAATARATLAAAEAVHAHDGAAIASGNISAARITAALNAGGAAPIYACRAWVEFNGPDGAIRAAGNVTSVTRNGVGDHTINFATAMQDAAYAVCASGQDGSFMTVASATAPTTVAVRVFSRGHDGLAYDLAYSNIAIFR